MRPPPAASSLLTSPVFLIALATLLLNDHVLKAAFGTWWTGKLSDVAGLFAFAVFWSALVPRRRAAVFALTAAGFALWTTPLADAPLTAWNALGVWPLGRVVDYTDWLALAVLVPAWRVVTGVDAQAARSIRPLRRLGAAASAAVALIAFSATSPPRKPSLPFPEEPRWMVGASVVEVIAHLRASGVEFTGSFASDTPRRDLAPFHASVALGRSASGDEIEVGALLAPAGDETRITLNFARQEKGVPVADEVLRMFVRQVIEPLQARYPPWAPTPGPD